MKNLVVNLVGKTKRVLLNGRDYIAAPMTLIVPGVLNGSKGPLYYPPEEIRSSVEAWNDIPILVNHPFSDEGRPISASTPGVFGRSGIGFLRNARIGKGGNLLADGYFDVDATKRVDERILSALKSSQPIELSTGLNTTDEPADNGSNHKGVPYSRTARNYKPDHLAVLPDEIGACSLTDGCGVLINQAIVAGLIDPYYDWQKDLATQATNSTPGRRRALRALARAKRSNKAKFKRGDKSGYKLAGKSVSRSTFSKKIGGVPDSYKENYSPSQPKDGHGRWGQGGGGGSAGSGSGSSKVYRAASSQRTPEEVSFGEGGGNAAQRKYPHMAHLLNGASVIGTAKTKTEAKAKAKELRAKGFFASLWKDDKGKGESKYLITVPESEANTMNTRNKRNPMTTKQEMAKKKVIDRLIALNSKGESCCWTEDDREVLNSLSMEKLVALQEQAEKDTERIAVSNAVKEGFGTLDPKELTEAAKTHKELVANQKKGEKKAVQEPTDNEKKAATEEKKPLTVDQWMETAPAEVRSAVTNAMRIESEEKQRIVARLVSNVAEDKRKAHSDRLLKRSLEELREDLAMFPTANKKSQQDEPTHNYFGAGGSSDPTSEFDKDDYLDLPTINYAEEAAARKKVG